MLQKKPNQIETQEEQIRRTRIPKGREVIGIVESRLGASRMRIRCFDSNIRVCRIPGRLKRKLWIREGDFVLVEPWEFGGSEKGDILYKYQPLQVEFLRKRGIIKQVSQEGF